MMLQQVYKIDCYMTVFDQGVDIGTFPPVNMGLYVGSKTIVLQHYTRYSSCPLMPQNNQKKANHHAQIQR
jgi:hypothetical protein